MYGSTVPVTSLTGRKNIITFYEKNKRVFWTKKEGELALLPLIRSTLLSGPPAIFPINSGPSFRDEFPWAKA
jgi:hypothetical protein